MNKKIGIIGAFDFKHNSMGGQPVKTRQFASTLEKEYGKKRIINIDTHYWKRDILKVLFGIVKVSFSCRTIVMLPAANGVLYFSKMLVAIKALFGRNIYYDVIGGWLPDLTEKNASLKRALMKFDGIFVETNHMRDAMLSQEFNNVFVLQNYKKLCRINPEDLNTKYTEPYDICTFSRVMEQKGIEDAITAVIRVNEKAQRSIYRLHIFGAVDNEYQSRFNSLCKSFPEYITYEGVVKPEKSVEALRGYFLLVFPTKFYTEGIPGTIIDAYAAGIPVVASKWESCSDVVKDGETGICYSFCNLDALVAVMEKIADDPQIIINMKQACLEESGKYTEAEFLKILKNYLEL